MDLEARQGTGDVSEVQITVLEPATCQEKEMNEIERKVLAELSGGLTQSEISRKFDLPKSTVNVITKHLLKTGLIRKRMGGHYNIQYERSDGETKRSDNHPIQKLYNYTRYCLNCGQKFITSNKEQRYYNPLCWGETTRGPNSPVWKGGEKYAPYCWLYNDSLKE